MRNAKEREVRYARALFNGRLRAAMRERVVFSPNAETERAAREARRIVFALASLDRTDVIELGSASA